MRIDPYLYLQGRCDEALDFYAGVLGATVVETVRFGAMGPPHLADKVMHAVLRVGETTVLATDGPVADGSGFTGFALALSASSDAQAEQVFAALSERGVVGFPMGPTPFASRFGVVTDRFGVAWNVVHQAAPAGVAA